MNKIYKSYPLLSFIGALLIFLSVSYLLRAFMTNIDEQDHIVTGYLMSSGKNLYTDIFTNHFPLPYYWISLFTPLWVNSEPARAITIFRSSITLLYLLSFVLVFISFKNPKSKSSYSLWIVLLSIFFSFYHGNLVLSETFDGIFISSIFWIVIPILLGWEKPLNYNIVTISLFVVAAFWTQPLLIILTPVPLLLSRHKKLTATTLFFLIISPLFFLFLMHNLKDFIDQALSFNLQTYSHFFPEQIDSYSITLQTVTSLLPNELSLLTNLRPTIPLTQFTSHLALIILLSFLAASSYKEKKWHYFAIVIILFLSARIRETKIITGALFNFGIYPLMLISSASLVILAFHSSKTIRLTGLTLLMTFIIPTIMAASPIFTQSFNPQYNFHVFWSYRLEGGQLINQLSKNSEKVLIYPHDVDLYFLAKRQPIDRFTYWFPWINSTDKYRNERMEVLKNNPPSVIYIGNLDYRETPRLYAAFFPYLTTNYWQIQKNGKLTNIYLRKDLVERVTGGLSISTKKDQNQLEN